MKELNSHQISFNPNEIATLLGDYYRLLARMRYFDPGCIKYPPHNPPIDVPLAKTLELEPQVIELLQILPYVQGYHNEDEFILNGSFADFRRRRVLMQSRDPDYVTPEGGYEEDNGQYVMPWVLVLNECGNHGSIMYFDTRNSHITMLWQGGAGGGPADPFFYGKFNWAEAEKREHPINKNRIEHFPSRPAKDMFADFSNNLMTLKWIPFDTYGHRIQTSDDKIEYPDLKLMFQTYGWPGALDVEGFDAASRRWKEFNRVRSDAKKILTEVPGLDKEIAMWKNTVENLVAMKKDGVWDAEVAKTPEDVVKLENRLQSSQERLEQLQERNKTIKEAEVVNDDDSAIEKAWEEHVKHGITRKKRDLDWFRSDGAKYATEEKMKELEVGIAALEERLKDVKTLPKIASDAIKHQDDPGHWICCM